MRGGGRMRGRSRNRPSKRQRMEQPITEQMQNLNMELEILRQKKEMMEQHQLMLENQRMYDQERKYAANNPRYYEQMYNLPGPSSFNKNNPRIYDNPADMSYIPVGSGIKRPAEQSWRQGPAAKRRPPKGNADQSFGWRQSSQQSKNRNKTGKTNQSAAKKNITNEELKLRPDCEPSPKVKGRIETTLGLILKEIKDNFGEEKKFSTILRDHRFLKALKTAIRERLTTMMMNKIVCDSKELYVKYRCNYRRLQDKVFLTNLMKEEIALNPSITPLSDDVIAAPMNPANFIKDEVGKMLNAEFREIFRKLEIVNNPKLNDREKSRRLANDSVDPTQFGANENDTEEIKEWKREFRQKIRQKLPKALLRNVPLMVKLLKLDMVYINTWTRMMSSSEDAGAGGVHKLNVGLEEETAFAPRFCARVRGVPKIPPKIRHFLEPFKPIWMKRSKYFRNLVFVAFRDRDGLVNLLKKNGAVFGNCNLRITGQPLKPNLNVATNKKNPKASKRTHQNTACKEKIKNERKKHDDSFNISSDLDNQITDLLSSIRRAEELEKDLNTAMIAEELTDDSYKREKTDCDEGANDQIEEQNEQSTGIDKESKNAHVSAVTIVEDDDESYKKSDDITTNDKLPSDAQVLADRQVGDDEANNSTEEPAVGNKTN